jgi:CrcB protein
VTQVLAVAAGGALGSVLRYGIASGLQALPGRAFPLGTFAVNVIGSLAIGFLSVWLLERADHGSALSAGLLVGLLGGFTTFSAFSLETFALLEAGAWLRAACYAALSVVLCVGAAWLGVIAARQL